MASIFPVELEGFIQRQRVGRLATGDGDSQPHLVPVCFAYNGAHFYTVIDQKPKRGSPLRLKRVRNILQNPRVALLLDHYEETWEKLAYLLVQGTAKVVEQGSEREDALALLRKKYPQYQCMDLNAAPVIQITPTRFVAWGALKEA